MEPAEKRLTAGTRRSVQVANVPALVAEMALFISPWSLQKHWRVIECGIFGVVF